MDGLACKCIYCCKFQTKKKLEFKYFSAVFHCKRKKMQKKKFESKYRRKKWNALIYSSWMKSEESQTLIYSLHLLCMFKFFFLFCMFEFYLAFHSFHLFRLPFFVLLIYRMALLGRISSIGSFVIYEYIVLYYNNRHTFTATTLFSFSTSTLLEYVHLWSECQKCKTKMSLHATYRLTFMWNKYYMNVFSSLSVFSFIQFYTVKFRLLFFFYSCEYVNLFFLLQSFFSYTTIFLPRFFLFDLMIFCCCWFFASYCLPMCFSFGVRSTREAYEQCLHFFRKQRIFFSPIRCVVHCVNLIFFCCSSIWHVIFFYENRFCVFDAGKKKRRDRKKTNSLKCSFTLVRVNIFL